MGNSVIEQVFGKDVFNDEVMQARLPKDVYKTWKKTLEDGTDLDPDIANVVAHAMKEWALEHGATHYTHWFQPMTGVTAEKHDSFLSAASKSRPVLEFSGKELIKGEPDASSFPSGGLRATFEARGYTAWDCTSPAFLQEDAAGVTLCIPTAFCSYTGEALDKKTPLLRSMQALSKQTIRLVKLFGMDDVKKVSCSVGPEQEYFLVDQKTYRKRKDLIFTGRTLFGAMPPKGQELDDHYFGAINERVESFMKDLNEECWKLGILAKTQHNEVAPSQHEIAPIYSEVNIATDHNQLVMELMKKVAKRHGLECLLSEKPFKGVNGSGKHNNWSIITDTGVNLLDPGKKPHENKLFLLVLAAVIAAVDENAVLLRLSASNPGNDHRLGANEAPPAIISIFLGEQLEDVIEQIIDGKVSSSIQGSKLDTGVSVLPVIKKDATDRNRTSPFAFTGNKFEFRMLGSSMSIADCNIVLNTIVADQFEKICDKLEGSADFENDVWKVIRELVTDHRRVIFNGDGYADAWVEEAAKRGLPNVKSMVESVEVLDKPETVKLFKDQNVYSESELKSRSEIYYENYYKTINIEALTMLDMTTKLYIPSVMSYKKQIAESINAIKDAVPGADVSVETKVLTDITSLLTETVKAYDKLGELENKASSIEDVKAKALYYRQEIVPAMDALRDPVDKLELKVDKKAWPVPSYGDLLFEV
ncbi:MAG: glutamine synthetase III [Lachnospiraceae bacterium]|nr:glutamine synthetase III [Lachnospiraceae bacterium]MEE3461302.1 glutamine synthetase III [Lachnospiraceae bacterium]